MNLSPDNGSPFRTLFIFNPEHDLALGVGNGPYTPPAEVRKIGQELALLPALYAGNSDFILVPENIKTTKYNELKYFHLVHDKKLTLLKPSELLSHQKKINRIIPWGWDFAIKKTLTDNGIDLRLLPEEGTLSKIRELSHRKTCIDFRRQVSNFLQKDLKFPTLEIKSLEELEEFLKLYPITFFKAPWSSSGRGIVVSDHISHKGLLEWTHGVIKKQGSVIAEPAWLKKLDFATEWWISKGNAVFIGLSVFIASSRGKYHGNITASQSELENIIKEQAPEFSYEIVEAQRRALNGLIAPYYDGPLGIDMLADEEGNINCCVEINLRLTMGMLSIEDFLKKAEL